jgi:hypothetical protein
MKLLRVLFFILPITLSAQLRSYSYYRELKPVDKTDFYEIKIGSGIIDREGHYRIYEMGKDTVEVPYIKEDQVFYSYDSRYFKNLKIIDEGFEKDKFSYATLVLDTNLIYNSVYLNVQGNEFFKDVTVEGSDDNKKWKTIIENEKIFSYFRGDDEHYFRNKIAFKDISYKYLRLKFDDSQSLKVLIENAYIPIEKQYNITTGEKVPVELKRTEDPKKKQTILEGTLPRKYLVTILNFNIKHTSPHFKRDYTVSLASNVGTKENWVFYGEGVLHSEMENSIFLNNYSTSDGSFKTDKVKITINNLDDVPLKDVTIDVFTHEEKIKLKLEAAKKYVIAYEKANDTAPQYDIEHFKNAIPFTLKEAEIGIVVTPLPKPLPVVTEPLVSNKKWIWVALIACIALIALFTLKLLKPNKDGQ